MRIGMQTWGSEGDIRPFLALGHALARRGHSVELLYTEVHDRRYERIAETLGFTARPVASPVLSDPAAIERIGLKILRSSNPLTQGLAITRATLEPSMPAVFEAGLDLCRRSDALIHHFMLHGARSAAEQTGTPFATVAFAFLQTPSRYIHPPGFPDFGEWGNAWQWKIAGLALNATMGRDVNRFRASIGMPPFADLMRDGWASPTLNLVAASPALLDRPRDWPSWYHVSGFLELPEHEHEAVPRDVERFLTSGPPPVYLGFGSMMPMAGMHHLEEAIAILEEAATRAGVRAIVQSAVDRPSTDHVLHVSRTPHRLVFPRCAAVVHHAGAGTTHATLRAGVPSVPVPHISDQFGWSDELRRLGVAPKAIPRTRLTADRLARRIREALASPAMKAAAVRISERMRTDNGPERAADLVETTFSPK